MTNAFTPAAQRAKPATPERVKRISLSNVTKGKVVDKPIRIILYSQDGVGKSTFASNAPNPIFICGEDGTDNIDTSRWSVSDWYDVMDAIAELQNGEHDYKTVVLDTADFIEPFIWRHLCATRSRDNGSKAEDVTDYGYGKGYDHALEFWRQLINGLEKLQRTRNMNVIILAHAAVKTFKNPLGEDFDHYAITLDKKASSLLRAWCEAVMFAQIEVFSHTDGKKRVRGVSDGARVMHTEGSAVFHAKNRYNLPAKLPLDYQAFAQAVAEGRTASPEKLIEKINALCEGLTDETLLKNVGDARDACNGDAVKLARVLDRLVAKIGILNQENE